MRSWRAQHAATLFCAGMCIDALAADAGTRYPVDAPLHACFTSHEAFHDSGFDCVILINLADDGEMPPRPDIATRSAPIMGRGIRPS